LSAILLEPSIKGAGRQWVGNHFCVEYGMPRQPVNRGIPPFLSMECPVFREDRQFIPRPGDKTLASEKNIQNALPAITPRWLINRQD
jgi:hypothetical protein